MSLFLSVLHQLQALLLLVLQQQKDQACQGMCSPNACLLLWRFTAAAAPAATQQWQASSITTITTMVTPGMAMQQ
jgi:hypothetical protein